MSIVRKCSVGTSVFSSVEPSGNSIITSTFEAAAQPLESQQLKLRVTKDAIDTLQHQVLGPHFEEVRGIMSLWRGGKVAASEHETQRSSVDFDEYVSRTLADMRR